MAELQAGATIGLVGGGQLARMMAAAAVRLGFRTVVLAPEKDCPAAQTAGEHILAAYDDRAALDRLVRLCDVITYEFENIPVAVVDRLAAEAVILPPPAALAIAQDRFLEKKFFNECAIATAPWHLVGDEETLVAALSACGGRGILKTRRFGYDGKGQVRIMDQGGDTVRMALESVGHAPAILEGFVPFVTEISVIAARDGAGEVVFYDVPENVHRDGILRTSTVPAAVSAETAEKAFAATAAVLHALEYTGIITVEFFVTAEGAVLANEFAPRVHNSGHWTEAACVISQFEQHIRAVAGLPLGDPSRHSDCVMENLIGEDLNRLPVLLREPGTFIHVYGKDEIRKNRKMGHVIHLIK